MPSQLCWKGIVPRTGLSSLRSDLLFGGATIKKSWFASLSLRFFICQLSKASFARRQIKNPTLRAGLFLLCPGLDSNQHILANAATWTQCVYQFRHLGIKIKSNLLKKLFLLHFSGISLLLWRLTLSRTLQRKWVWRGHKPWLTCFHVGHVLLTFFQGYWSSLRKYSFCCCFLWRKQWI